MTILQLSPNFTMMQKYAKTRLGWVLLNEIEGIEDFQLYTQVIITTESVVISRRCFAKKRHGIIVLKNVQLV